MSIKIVVADWIGEIPSHWKKSRLKYESLVPVQYGLNIN